MEQAAEACAVLVAESLRKQGIRCSRQSEMFWNLAFEKIIRIYLEDDEEDTIPRHDGAGR